MKVFTAMWLTLTHDGACVSADDFDNATFHHRRSHFPRRPGIWNSLPADVTSPSSMSASPEDCSVNFRSLETMPHDDLFLYAVNVVILPLLGVLVLRFVTDKRTGDDTKAAARRRPNWKTKKYGEERFSIWQLEFFFPLTRSQ